MSYLLQVATLGLTAALLPIASGAPAPTAKASNNSHVREVQERSHPLRGNPVNVVENYTAARKLFKKDPSHWGGAFVDGDNLVINYVGQPLEEAKSRLRAAGVKGAVELKESFTSMNDFQKAKDSILANVPRNSGISVVAPNYSTGEVDVDFAGKVTQKELDLVDRAVPKHIKSTISGGVPRGNTKASRWYDTISYNGGNGITLAGSSSAVYCSTAFNLTGAGGYAYAVTASHCYVHKSATRPNVKVHRQGGVDSGMGTVWSASGDSNGTISGRPGDIAIYRYTPVAGYTAAQMGNPTIYTGDGDAGLNSRRRVSAVGDLPPGTYGNIKTSGASGYGPKNYSIGEISPDWVSDVDADWTYSDGYTVRGITVVQDAGECVSPGDSGGAVYQLLGNGTVRAVGVISGSNGQGWGPTNCKNIYTPITDVWMGGSVKLG